MYTGFFNRDEAIALPLIEALCELDPEKEVFEHVGQLDKGGEKPPIVWTEDYYKKLMTGLEGSKIWVCGPPIVQENFDRASMQISSPKIEFAAM